MALVSEERSPARTGARSALQTYLRANGGNFSATGLALGVGRAAVSALVAALDLGAWVAQTWPGHRAGGGHRR